MAFLCPARRRKSKIKIRGPRPLDAPIPGRITGSDSIDTLVRVGLEKEAGPRAKMVVLHDFHPCVDDELAVKRGQEVYVLYQENDWLYVIAGDNKEGFVPYTYCLPIQRCVDDFMNTTNNHATNNNNQVTKIKTPNNPANLFKSGISFNSNNNKPGQRNYENLPPRQVYIDLTQRNIEENDEEKQQQQNKHDKHKNSKHSKNKKSSKKHSQQEDEVVVAAGKPAYQFGPVIKEGKNLTRRSSKSLPDISDISASSPSRYPLSSTNESTTAKPRDTEENDQTYGMTLKRESRSTLRRPQSASYDYHVTGSTATTGSGGRSQSQPASPSRTALNSNYFGQNIMPNQSRSTPGTPVTSHHTIRRTSGRHSDSESYGHSSGSQKLRSWGTNSAQVLMNQLKSDYFNQSRNQSGRNLSSSYSGVPRSNSLDGSYGRGISTADKSLSSSYPNTSMVHQSDRHSTSSYQHSPGSVSVASAYKGVASNQVESFKKTSQGEYIVLYSFSAQQENDINVERGETVVMLNSDDNDWIWVRRSDNMEGFIPSNYVIRTETSQNKNTFEKNGFRTSSEIETVKDSPQWANQDQGHKNVKTQYNQNNVLNQNSYNARNNQQQQFEKASALSSSYHSGQSSNAFSGSYSGQSSNALSHSFHSGQTSFHTGQNQNSKNSTINNQNYYPSSLQYDASKQDSSHFHHGFENKQMKKSNQESFHNQNSTTNGYTNQFQQYTPRGNTTHGLIGKAKQPFSQTQSNLSGHNYTNNVGENNTNTLSKPSQVHFQANQSSSNVPPPYINSFQQQAAYQQNRSNESKVVQYINQNKSLSSNNIQQQVNHSNSFQPESQNGIKGQQQYTSVNNSDQQFQRQNHGQTLSTKQSHNVYYNHQNHSKPSENHTQKQFYTKNQSKPVNETTQKFPATQQLQMPQNNQQHQKHLNKPSTDNLLSSQTNGQLNNHNQTTVNTTNTKSTTHKHNSHTTSSNNNSTSVKSDFLAESMGMQRILCLYNYEAQAPDDVTIARGEYVYANLSQADPDWLWIYHPGLHQSGYVPRSYTKTPAVY